jgi:hypothetical protein
MARKLVWLAMVVAGVALVLDVWYFIGGSMELYPTEEQQDKIRLATGVIAVFLASLEAGLWLLLRRMGSKPASRTVG